MPLGANLSTDESYIGFSESNLDSTRIGHGSYFALFQEATATRGVDKGAEE